MLEFLKTITASVTISVEAAGALLVAYGAAEALFGSVLAIAHRRTSHAERKEVWLRFGVWLLLGLEFQLAADVVRTAVSPSWRDIGQLAAIAAIRTFLSFFLQRDLDNYELRKKIETKPIRPVAA